MKRQTMTLHTQTHSNKQQPKFVDMPVTHSIVRTFFFWFNVWVMIGGKSWKDIYEQCFGHNTIP